MNGRSSGAKATGRAASATVMSTASEADSSSVDSLSPELALVDAELARVARARLPHRPWAAGAPAHERARGTIVLSIDDVRGAGRAAERARQRLLAGSVYSELPPDTRHFRRRATLLPTTSASAAVLLLVLQLCLGHGNLA